MSACRILFLRLYGHPVSFRPYAPYLTEEEVVLLVAMYSKAERTNMSPAEVRKVV